MLKLAIDDGLEETEGIFTLIASGDWSIAESSTFFGLSVNK